MAVWACTAMLAMVASQAPQEGGQNVPAGPQVHAPQEEIATGPGGFWPTERMIELMTHRWADEVSQRYGLDDRQQAAWADRIAERWTRFSREHRERMAPLVNQFIEMRLDMKPPTADQVRSFAERAGPAFDLFRDELVSGGRELRDLLKPGQRARFDTDMMGMTAGLETARKKLDLWQSGEFNENDFWDPPRSVRDRRRAEQNAAHTAEGTAGGSQPGDGASVAAAPEESPPDQIEIELDNWQKYVERFIRVYRLDDPQTAAAHSILKELRERAIGHRDAHRQEIEDLERRIARHDGTPEELSELETRIADLYGPIDQLFEQLKTRLDGIPTRGQRDGVGRSEQQEKQRR